MDVVNLTTRYPIFVEIATKFQVPCL